jgi:bifunctional UDP-N-acetylglucosamine pyrophosphorylase/glucosamine-1-phosphate N-acetyltransferase
MGVVKMEADLVVQIVEKPSLEEAPSDIASVPLYCFRQRLLDYLPEVKPSRRGEIELQDAIQALICQDGNVRGVHVSSRMDLTKPEDLLRINQHYLTNGFSTGPISDCEPGKDTEIVPPVYYERNVEIGEHCQLGPNVYIEHSSTIGDHVTLRNAVVLRERQVFSGAEISGQVIF